MPLPTGPVAGTFRPFVHFLHRHPLQIEFGDGKEEIGVELGSS